MCFAPGLSRLVSIVDYLERFAHHSQLTTSATHRVPFVPVIYCVYLTELGRRSHNTLVSMTSDAPGEYIELLHAPTGSLKPFDYGDQT